MKSATRTTKAGSPSLDPDPLLQPGAPMPEYMKWVVVDGGGYYLQSTRVPKNWPTKKINLVSLSVRPPATPWVAFWGDGGKPMGMGWIGHRMADGPITRELMDQLMAEWIMDHGRLLS